MYGANLFTPWDRVIEETDFFHKGYDQGPLGLSRSRNIQTREIHWRGWHDRSSSARPSLAYIWIRTTVGDGNAIFQAFASLIILPLRVCPGRYFAQNTLSIIAASILHAFKVTPGLDSDGQPVQVDVQMVGGLLAYVLHLNFHALY